MKLKRQNNYVENVSVYGEEQVFHLIRSYLSKLVTVLFTLLTKQDVIITKRLLIITAITKGSYLKLLVLFLVVLQINGIPHKMTPSLWPIRWIENIHLKLNSLQTLDEGELPQPSFSGIPFTVFQPVLTDDIEKLAMKAPNNTL